MARLFLGTLIALVMAAGLSAGPQQNVPTRPPAADPHDQDPFPDRATLAATKRTVDNRPLFSTNDLLVFSLVADFGQVQHDRTPDGDKMYPASVVVTQKGGKEVSIPAKIRTRGHSRLKPDFCTFAPLRVEFDANPVGTVFEGQKKLKLGVHCRDGGEYPDYVVREYPVYRMFNVLTPRSFRARLAEAHYVDVKSRKTIGVRGALFLEDDDDVARRMEGRISDTTGLRYRRLDPDTSTLATLYEYMIGNTDLSIRSLHNMRVVLTPGGTRYPVPYDFDFAGVVNAQYAGPSPMLKSLITHVRERLYLGPCRTPEELEKTFKHFRDKRADLMAVYDTAPMLKPKYVADAKKYLEQFYTTIERPDRVKKAFIDNCEARPYM